VGALKILLPPVAAYLEKKGSQEAERHLRALDALDGHVRVGEIPSDAVLLATLLAPLPREGAPRGPIPKQQEQQPADADEELDQELSALEEQEGDPAQAPLPEAALREEAELHDERLGGVPSFAVGGDVQPWSLPQDVVAPEIVLAEMVRTARLPRRIAERARMILLAQPVLAGERRRKRSSPQAFARQSYFPEALAVFELSVAATGRGHEQLAKWQAAFAGQDLSQVEHREPEARRRRRRGGRGRGRAPHPAKQR
jgi:poly(A) polymerase